MKIDSTTDYDKATAGCGCCGYPDCEGPRTEYQSIGAESKLEWEIFNAVELKYYRVYRIDYGDGGFIEQSYDQDFSVWVDGYPTEPSAGISIATEIVTEGEPKTGGTTTSITGVIDVDAARDNAWSALASGIDWNNTNLVFGAEERAIKVDKIPFSTLDTLFTATYVRYRVGVPADYSTSVYNVEWDVAFVPDEYQDWLDEYQYWLENDYATYLADLQYWEECMADYNDTEICGLQPTEPTFDTPEPTNKPSLIAHYSWSYTGASEFSDWYDMEAPTANDGSNRVVNMKVKCYNYSTGGVKPTLIGEQLTLI